MTPVPENARVGLCATCQHCTMVVSGRGGRFYLCERSRSDPRYPRYPPLPVLECRGWEARPHPIRQDRQFHRSATRFDSMDSQAACTRSSRRE